MLRLRGTSDRRLAARGGCSAPRASARLRLPAATAARGRLAPCRGSSGSRAPRAKARGRRCLCRPLSLGRRAAGTAARGIGRRPRTNGATLTPRAWSAQPRRRESWSIRVSAAARVGAGLGWGPGELGALPRRAGPPSPRACPVLGRIGLPGRPSGRRLAAVPLARRGNRPTGINLAGATVRAGTRGIPAALAPSARPPARKLVQTELSEATGSRCRGWSLGFGDCRGGSRRGAPRACCCLLVARALARSGRRVGRVTALRLGREVRSRAVGFVENKADLCLLLESRSVHMGGVCSATQVSMARPLLLAFLTQGHGHRLDLH